MNKIFYVLFVFILLSSCSTTPKTIVKNEYIVKVIVVKDKCHTIYEKVLNCENILVDGLITEDKFTINDMSKELDAEYAYTLQVDRMGRKTIYQVSLIVFRFDNGKKKPITSLLYFTNTPNFAFMSRAHEPVHGYILETSLYSQSIKNELISK